MKKVFKNVIILVSAFVISISCIVHCSAASYSDGYKSGYDIGFSNGKSKGYNDGFWSGYSSGYRIGHMRGVKDGEKTGYDTGKADGYEEGKAEGYEEGIAIGYQQGINNAKTEASKSSEENIAAYAISILLILFIVVYVSVILTIRFMNPKNTAESNGAGTQKKQDDIMRKPSKKQYSNIIEDYWHKGDELFVVTKKGDTYRYKGVPLSVFEEMARSRSVSAFFINNISGEYPYDILK